jgi:hypothetical protein
MKAVAIGMTAIFLAGTTALAASHQAYCYATAQSSGSKIERYLTRQCTIFITPVFKTEDSADLLSAEFNEAIPESGIATCVTEEDEPDLPRAWQEFIDNGKADKCTITMQSPPGQAAPDNKPGG